MILISDATLRRDIKNLPKDHNPGRSEVMRLTGIKFRTFYTPADFCIKRFTSKGGPVRKNLNTSAFIKKNVALDDGIAELKKFNSETKKHKRKQAK